MAMKKVVKMVEESISNITGSAKAVKMFFDDDQRTEYIFFIVNDLRNYDLDNMSDNEIRKVINTKSKQLLQEVMRNNKIFKVKKRKDGLLEVIE